MITNGEDDPKEVYQKKLRAHYNNVMGQAISDSGRFLFAGSCFGDIFVHDLNDLDRMEDQPSKVQTFPQEDSPDINFLCTHGETLIVAASGVIYGLDWNEGDRSLSRERKWEIHMPMSPEAEKILEPNFLYLQPETNTIFAGCSDNKIYQIDLETHKILHKFTGHTNIVHAITGCEDGRIVSASEDGTVRFWVERTKDPVAMIEPATKDKLQRNNLGNWIGAVAVRDDWLICGGGPKCSIWYLGSLECTGDYPFPGPVHMCDFVDDNIVVGGGHPEVHFYTLDGKSFSKIPVTHTASYSVVWQEKPIKFMSISGYSNQLHILRDFRFLDRKIDLYGYTDEQQ